MIKPTPSIQVHDKQTNDNTNAQEKLTVSQDSQESVIKTQILESKFDFSNLNDSGFVVKAEGVGLIMFFSFVVIAFA